jgi:hypothetical protein
VLLVLADGYEQTSAGFSRMALQKLEMHNLALDSDEVLVDRQHVNDKLDLVFLGLG